jgi:hypothetical protein
MSDNDHLDTTAPDKIFYALLGEVNYVAVLLNLDPVELGITIGRIETQAKISKMLSIVRHRRKDDLSTFLANIKTN